MSVHTDIAIKYDTPASNHGSYKFNRVLPQGTSSVTLNPTSQTEVLLDLPNRVYNLSKSTLECSVFIPQGVPGNWLYTQGQSLLRRVSLYTRTGVFLMDLTDTHLYTRSILPYVTSVEKCKSFDRTELSGTAAEAAEKGRASFNCISNALKNQADAFGEDATRMAENNQTVDADVNYNECKYVSYAGAASDGYLACSIPLSEIGRGVI
jgi:hypothetical protein